MSRSPVQASTRVQLGAFVYFLAVSRRGMTYDAPQTYARLIGPRYAPIADALVKATAIRKADDVLELGAGTGLLTTRVAPLVSSVVASDASAAMLEHARAARPRRRNVSYQLLDYTAPFPFLDNTFSLVLSGLTFVQNSPAALAEVARVLKPSGRVALSMWGQTYQEKRLLNSALTSLGGGRFPNAAPSVAVRRLERTGFRSLKRADIELTNDFASVDDYLDYRRGFGIPAVWTRAFYEQFLRAVHREASRQIEADGSFKLGWTITLITARAPRSGA